MGKARAVGVRKPVDTEKLEAKINDLSRQEIKELLLVNAYKLALVRSQLEALTDVLVKNRLITRDEVWRRTKENFDDSSL